jgi:hypothetical protein
MQKNITDELVSLDDVLAYRHSGVIRRYRKEHNSSEQEAEEVFRETIKWLYLCHRAAADGPDGFDCSISGELEKIDWMWHTFLLLTRDYADFCDRFFGTFIHHVPNDDEDEVAEEKEEALRQRLNRQFGLVFDLLGEETLTVWYDECRYAVPA